MIRKIVQIDETKCNGCGQCIPSCHEGALSIVDGKAQLIGDLYCDGLGDCLGSCPMDAITIIEREAAEYDEEKVEAHLEGLKETPKKLDQWPIQLNLFQTDNPRFNDSHILIAADCVGFAYPHFHSNLLGDKTLLIGCPKLDDSQHYLDKLTAIFADNSVQSVEVARMEVPCCSRMSMIVNEAIKSSGKDIPFKETIVSRGGTLLS